MLGRDITPYVLKRVNELSAGMSLKSSNFHTKKIIWLQHRYCSGKKQR